MTMMRELQAFDFTNATRPPRFDNNDYNGGERNIFQFFGFLAWYCFLVLCCIIPPCIAYRRRRLLEARTARQIIFLGTADFPNHSNNANELSPEQRLQLGVMIKLALKETTMIVKEGDIVQTEDTPNDDEEEEEGQASSSINVDPPDDIADLEQQRAEASCALKLPASSLNGDRIVSGACAICLTPYEVDDEVSFAPNTECVHAFHSECIVSWLQKKPSEPNCPCCRQPFCSIAGDDDDIEIPEDLILEEER